MAETKQTPPDANVVKLEDIAKQLDGLVVPIVQKGLIRVAGNIGKAAVLYRKAADSLKK